jgi:hypothetical protein
VALVALLGRLRAGRLPPAPLAALCLALIALTGVDGLNAFLFDGGLPHLYTPSTSLRLLTGFGAGYGLAVLALPAVAGVVWRAPLDDEVLGDGVELGMGLVVCAVVAGLLLVDVAPLLWPMALLMLASVLVDFGVANLFLATLATGRQREAQTASDLTGLGAVALGLALVELAGLAALRGWLAATFGLVWGA